MSPDQIQATQLLGKAVLETIQECGTLGAPSGPIYAALMSKGISLSIYQQLIASLARNCLISESSEHLLTITPEGETFLVSLKKKFSNSNAIEIK